MHLSIRHSFIIALVLVLFLSTVSCSGGKRFYQKKSYRAKSKKIKLHNSKKKSDFKFQLYRYRDSQPISN